MSDEIRHNIFGVDQEGSSDAELTGADYLNYPTQELMRHPDYSPHAHRVVIAISGMTTAQLEQLTFGGN
jgi:hypothetical protein